MGKDTFHCVVFYNWQFLESQGTLTCSKHQMKHLTVSRKWRTMAPLGPRRGLALAELGAELGQE